MPNSAPFATMIGLDGTGSTTSAMSSSTPTTAATGRAARSSGDASSTKRPLHVAIANMSSSANAIATASDHHRFTKSASCD